MKPGMGFGGLKPISPFGLGLMFFARFVSKKIPLQAELFFR